MEKQRRMAAFTAKLSKFSIEKEDRKKREGGSLERDQRLWTNVNRNFEMGGGENPVREGCHEIQSSQPDKNKSTQFSLP